MSLAERAKQDATWCRDQGIESLGRTLDTCAERITALEAVLKDFVTYVNPGDDVPLAAMIDDARAVIAKAKP